MVDELVEGYNMIRNTLHDGSAVAKFAEMLIAQGVEPTVANRLCEKGADVFQFLQKSKRTTELKSKHTGNHVTVRLYLSLFSVPTLRQAFSQRERPPAIAVLVSGNYTSILTQVHTVNST